MSDVVTSDTYFDALACFYCKRNRLYRIFLCPDELVFIWAGVGLEGVAGARAAAARGRASASPAGVIGVLVGDVLESALDSTKTNLARLDKLRHAPLEELINDHPQNMRMTIADCEQVRIRPRSDAHARAFGDHAHQARLFIRHRTLGKYRLGISSVRDTQVACTELPAIFGDKCRVEIEWPEREQKCGCRFCRLKYTNESRAA